MHYARVHERTAIAVRSRIGELAEARMSLHLIAVAATGIVLGNCVRAPALIVATALTVAVVAVAGGFDGLTGVQLVLAVLLSVATLQVAYLIGVFLSVAWHRILERVKRS
jgi:hypothetical protein